MKDHQIAQLINDLRDVANDYAGTDQLREVIAAIIRPVFSSQQVQGDPEYHCLDCKVEHATDGDCQLCGIRLSVIHKEYRLVPTPKQEPVGCVVQWRNPDEPPDVKLGKSQKFWLCCENEKGKQYVFTADYYNYPMDQDNLDDHDFNDQNGDPFDAVGWFDEKLHDSYDTYVEQITFSDQYKLLGWAEYSPPYFGVNGAASQAAAIPEGWKLVPVEMTHDIGLAINSILPATVDAADVWKMILSAAPKPEVEQ